MEPLFSLVVTSYAKPAELDRFFAGLLDQKDCGDLQLIYVNQTDQNSALFTQITQCMDAHEIRTNGRVPLSVARNLGLVKATGRYIGFPDDDCWYHPRLLAEVVAFIQSHPDADCVCVNVFDPERRCTYGHRPLGVTCKIDYRNVFLLGTSVGIFARREALQRAGMYFDSELGAGTPVGSGEEMELLARMLETGARLLYAGDILVYHEVPIMRGHDARKTYRYGVGYGHLHARFLRRGHWPIMRGFILTVFLSVGGIAYYALDPDRRTIYWHRLLGISHGFWRTLFHFGGSNRSAAANIGSAAVRRSRMK